MYFCADANICIMRNRYVLLLIAVVLLSASCEKSVEEPARRLLADAKELYASDEYNKARTLIDSISVAYPKAYKTRREAEVLRREVMLKEKQRDVGFFAGMCEMLSVRRDSILAGFVFNKDERYQDTGYYTVASQDLKINQSNSFLRASVRENGDAYLASYYRGAKISHNTLKVSSGDSFVICDAPILSRSYWNYGLYNERREFRYGADGGIMDFIASATSPLKVELAGSHGKYEYMLRDEDVAAIKRIVELANLLKMYEETCEMRDEAQRSLDFLIKSQQRSQENELMRD